MPKVRPGWRGKYELTKHEFYTAYHYALQYPEWVDKRNSLMNTAQAIRYDKDRVQTSPTQDALEKTAIKAAELSEKIQLVEETAKEADPEIWPWILKAATTEGTTFWYLKTVCGLPCEKDMYYDRRRKFYWLLSDKLS